jgi:hypothetical protein
VVHSHFRLEAKPAAAIPKLTPAPPSKAIMTVTLRRTSRIDTAPTPGWVGWAAPTKP